MESAEVYLICFQLNVGRLDKPVVDVMVFFFFFQAEDGIRDKLVTGVQTCALTICWRAPPAAAAGRPQLGGVCTWGCCRRAPAPGSRPPRHDSNQRGSRGRQPRRSTREVARERRSLPRSRPPASGPPPVGWTPHPSPR